jgi:hypothetical protein
MLLETAMNDSPSQSITPNGGSFRSQSPAHFGSGGFDDDDDVFCNHHDGCDITAINQKKFKIFSLRDGDWGGVRHNLS